MPGGGGGQMARDMDSIERIRAGPAAGGKSPDQMSPQELYSVMWQVLTFRDKGQSPVRVPEYLSSNITSCQGYFADHR
jgi:hypothetical protein